MSLLSVKSPHKTNTPNCRLLHMFPHDAIASADYGTFVQSSGIHSDFFYLNYNLCGMIFTKQTCPPL